MIDAIRNLSPINHDFGINARAGPATRRKKGPQSAPKPFAENAERLIAKEKNRSEIKHRIL